MAKKTLQQVEDDFRKIGEFGQGKNTPVDNDLLRVIQNWGEQLAAQMRINLLQNKAVASKRLLGSIASIPQPTPQGFNIKVEMENYWQWVENGRPPTSSKGGGKPLYKELEMWIAEKNIKDKFGNKYPSRKAEIKSLAYVIARKIHQKGYKKRPFVEPALQKVTVDILVDRIEKYIADSIEK